MQTRVLSGNRLAPTPVFPGVRDCTEQELALRELRRVHCWSDDHPCPGFDGILDRPGNSREQVLARRRWFGCLADDVPCHGFDGIFDVECNEPEPIALGSGALSDEDVARLSDDERQRYYELIRDWNSAKTKEEADWIRSQIVQFGVVARERQIAEQEELFQATGTNASTGTTPTGQPIRTNSPAFTSFPVAYETNRVEAEAAQLNTQRAAYLSSLDGVQEQARERIAEAEQRSQRDKVLIMVAAVLIVAAFAWGGGKGKRRARKRAK